MKNEEVCRLLVKIRGSIGSIQVQIQQRKRKFRCRRRANGRLQGCKQGYNCSNWTWMGIEFVMDTSQILEYCVSI